MSYILEFWTLFKTGGDLRGLFLKILNDSAAIFKRGGLAAARDSLDLFMEFLEISK